MSKKLPGLNRRAPDIDGDDNASPPPEREAKAASKKPRRTRRKAGDREPPRDAAASEGTRKIETEILPPENAGGISPNFPAAAELVRRHSNWAMVGGLVPIPFVDIVAVAGIQIRMLNELSALYGVPFRENRAKSIVTALIGSILPYAAGTGLAGMIGKSMPILGWGIGLGTISLLSGATTQAAGAVFIQHFESGGTFMNFKPAAYRARYRDEFEKARRAHAGATA